MLISHSTKYLHRLKSYIINLSLILSPLSLDLLNKLSQVVVLSRDLLRSSITITILLRINWRLVDVLKHISAVLRGDTHAFHVYVALYFIVRVN